MKFRRLYLLSIALLLVIGVASISFAGVVVIVNPQNPTSSLSSHDLANIYRLKKTTWGTGWWVPGIKIKPVNLRREDPIRKTFSEIILKKDTAAMEKFYLKRALSGKGQPPKVLNSSIAVRDFVKYYKNTIGYIDEKDVDDSVKVIFVDGKKQID